MKRRPDSDSENGKISLPWIGPAYENYRILVLGENFYECGGLEAETILIQDAMKQMKQNKKRVFGGESYSSDGKKYRGTFLYYRMACYSKTLTLFLDQAVASVDLLELGEASKVVGFLDFVAHTNHIKCSPSGNLSRPELEMWQQCGKHILSDEIEILEPKWIIVMGKVNNAHYLSQFVFPTSVHANGAVGGTVGQIHGRLVNVIVVPHPSYFRYKINDVASGIIEMAKTLLNAESDQRRA